MTKILLIFIYAAFTIVPLKNSLGEILNTEISQEVISISSDFTGKKILLFGNKEVEGEIIISITGPKERTIVHEKKPRFGIWVNSKKIIFSDIPSYYAIASSRNINEIIPKETQKKLAIGAENLIFKTDSYPHITDKNISNFKFGLIRNKIRQKLYSSTENSVKFNNNLFRSDINFPTNAPEGKYIINTYLVNNNKIINTKENSIFITKVGVERQIYNFAHEKPALYGLLAIFIAILSGSLASIIFRKI
ncbi:MAG: hypothetical protein CMM18_02900 [Rhodospirillaceae bacterium]|nr:hypothetical protein [Rhodospirillaceae bacterium]